MIIMYDIFEVTNGYISFSYNMFNYHINAISQDL